jgi:hypothetical protein
MRERMAWCVCVRRSVYIEDCVYMQAGRGGGGGERERESKEKRMRTVLVEPIFLPIFLCTQPS